MITVIEGRNELELDEEQKQVFIKDLIHITHVNFKLIDRLINKFPEELQSQIFFNCIAGIGANLTINGAFGISENKEQRILALETIIDLMNKTIKNAINTIVEQNKETMQ